MAPRIGPGARSAGEVAHLLAHTRPGPDELAALLRRADADRATVHAAVLHLDRRVREGDWPDTWTELLPSDLTRLPTESQLVLAALAVDGYRLTGPGTAAAATTTTPPAVRLAWARAALLEHPPALAALAGTPLGQAAVNGLPVARVVATGLLERLASSAEATMRAAAVGYLRDGLLQGLVARAHGHELALRLAEDPVASIACAALHLLAQAWTYGLPLPWLANLAPDAEVRSAHARLLSARHELAAVRRLLARPGLVEQPSLAAALLGALGRAGDGADVATALGLMAADPASLGSVGLAALVALRRRGVGPDVDEALRLLGLYLDGPRLDAGDVAEVLAGRVEPVLEVLDRRLAPPPSPPPPPPVEPPWSRVVALLAGLHTRRATQRLVQIVERPEARAGWPAAIEALGRLGHAEAEPLLLTRLSDAPDATLAALRVVGTDLTVATLTRLVDDDAAAGTAPAWLEDAARLLATLAPSPAVLDRLIRRGVVGAELLAALPSHGGHDQAGALRELVTRPGHPLRRAAVAALGRAGGPLAMPLLAPLLGEADDELRADVVNALRALGPRLAEAGRGAPRPGATAMAHDPAEALVAEAALAGLRDRTAAPEVLTRLLDVLAGRSHPDLVAVVRPYLRSSSPPVRARAVTCLGQAGPRAAGWVVPLLTDEDPRVVRAAVRALAQLGAVGVGPAVAAWLGRGSMNLRKEAAEVLATLGDPRVVPALLGWLAGHDNPGFRQLLVAALRAILGPWFVSALLDHLGAEPEPARRRHLIDALDGELSAEAVAAVLVVRGDGAWATQWRQRIDAGACVLAQGSAVCLDRALRRGGWRPRPGADPAEAEGPGASRAAAQRAGAALHQAVRALAAGGAVDAALVERLGPAAVHGQVEIPTLSEVEVHALLDVMPALTEAAHAGAWQVLAGQPLDALARARVAERVRASSTPARVPVALARALAPTLSEDEAVRWVDAPDAVLGAAAAAALASSGRFTVATWPGRDPSRGLVERLRRASLDDAVAWCQQHGRLADLVPVLHRDHGAAVALAQVAAWTTDDPQRWDTLLPAVEAMGPVADDLLMAALTSSRPSLRARERMVGALAPRAASLAGTGLYHHLLGSEHVVLREHAAAALLAIGVPADRRRVVAAYLDGSFREVFALRPHLDDVPALAAAADVGDDAVQLRLVRLLRGLALPHQVPSLLALWRSGSTAVREACRDAMRALAPPRVAAFMRAELAGGELALLDLIGPTRLVPIELVGLAAAASATDLAPWVRFFARMAEGDTLVAPGLAAVLARACRTTSPDRDALRVLVRLADWGDPARVGELATMISPSLAGSDRAALLGLVVDATADLAPARRRVVLAALGRPGDEAVVAALVDTILVEPAAAGALPAGLAVAVDEHLRRGLDGEAERTRAILTFRAAAAASELDRVELVELLERALQHRSARVRLHAHRLLRVHAERPRYLAATRLLLGDNDATTVRSAIRTLAFARDVESTVALAELVSHGHAVVRAAARAGLLHLGPEALPGLVRVLARVRPDRRPALTEIVDRIEAGAEGDDDDLDEADDTPTSDLIGA
jgi:HEAT repeat protein